MGRMRFDTWLLVVALCVSCGRERGSGEDAPARLEGPWICYAPGAVDDPNAVDVGIATHLQISHVYYDGEPTGLFRGTWTGIMTSGEVDGSWAEGRISVWAVDPNDQRARLEPRGWGGYAVGDRVFTLIVVKPSIAGVPASIGETVTCVRSAGL